MKDNLFTILQGVPTSCSITIAALFFAFILAMLLTLILTLKIPVLSLFTKFFITIFTGTPLLIQIFIIYYGPGQFKTILIHYPFIWSLFSQPLFCIILALTLNSAAYSTLLFHGMVKAIPNDQWQACYALGMNKIQSVMIILPYALKRAISAYSNEVILIFKATSLASMITIMDIMGYTQRLFEGSYDFTVYLLAGAIYFIINSLLTYMMRRFERRMLAFELRTN